AMWSTVLSEISVTVYQLWAVRHLLNFKELFADSWKYFTAGLVMFVPVFWMNMHLSNSWIMMGIEIVIGILVYGIMILILRASIIGEAKELLKGKLHR